jgi:L-seryl-tRNA(Ser) seleniumtransferase
LVVNNCAAATMLVLQAIAGGREVIVSRGQLVEIGGGFRLPDVFRAAGVVLREVGTTNRTYLRDYENACDENTGAVIRVHRSNFRQTGFVTEPSIDELVGADLRPAVPVIDDLGSGLIHDLSKFGLAEPSVCESVRAGADLTLFSGDKLFGGPQAGMIVAGDASRQSDDGGFGGDD